LKAAQIDVQCKIQVNLIDTVSQTKIDYEQNAINANLPAVQHLKQLGLAAVQKAEAVMSGQPS